MIEGGGDGRVEIRIAPRFDYGQVRPWIRRHGPQLHSAIGGNDGLVVWCEHELRRGPRTTSSSGAVTVSAGERVHLHC